MEPEPKITMGRFAEVTRPLDVWGFMGGWGDGPMVLHPGAKVYLEHQVDNQVFFSSGIKRDPTILGRFSASDLGAVRDL